MPPSLIQPEDDVRALIVGTRSMRTVFQKDVVINIVLRDAAKAVRDRDAAIQALTWRARPQPGGCWKRIKDGIHLPAIPGAKADQHLL